jgi:hypothetical protein
MLTFAPMTITRAFLIGMALVLSGITALPAAESAKASAANVLNQVRLRQLTRALELTEEQQKKVQALLVIEADKIAKIDATTPTLNERTVKVNALKKETQESIRPILTPAQVEKFESYTKPPQRPRRKA